MNPFEFVIAIVAICVTAGIIRTAIHSSHRHRPKRQVEDFDRLSERLEGEMHARLDKLESRLGNIETIVIDHEKAQKFEALK